MKPHPAITAAARCTRYVAALSHRPTGEGVTPPPPLAFEDDDGSATAAWLAHIDAGRIKVR